MDFDRRTFDSHRHVRSYTTLDGRYCSRVMTCHGGTFQEVR